MLSGWFYDDDDRLRVAALRRCAATENMIPWWVDHAGTIHWDRSRL